MKLTPQGNRLLVQVIDDATTAKLTILLPDAKDSYGMPRKGKVVAVGNGFACVNADFREGQIVHFSKYHGQPMKISPRTFEELGEHFVEGQEYLFLNTKDIFGRTPNNGETKTTPLALEEKCVARRSRTRKRNADPNENAPKSKGQQKRTRT